MYLVIQPGFLAEPVRCETSDAPLGQIDAALEAGQPVIVRVDASPNPGLQWHYVLVYARNGPDAYLMLAPWPYKPGTNTADSLMKRYSQGQPLRRAIQQVVLYDVAGAGGAITIPSSSTTTTTTTTPTTTPTASGTYARVMDSVTSGLNIRSSKDTSSKANILIAFPAGTQLLLLDPGDAAKIGQVGQWLKVQGPGGQKGFAAAQYLEKVPSTASASIPDSPSSPTTDAPASTPIPSTTADTSTTTTTPATPSVPPDTTTPTPAADAGKMKVMVSEAVGPGGLRLRKAPSTGGALVMVLKAGTCA